MARRDGAVVFAGPICSGKSTLASALADARNATLISARAVLAAQLEGPSTRRALQELGARLEKSTAGAWLADAASASTASVVVVDSARTTQQVAALQQERETVVVYLTAPRDLRRRRYEVDQRDEPAFEVAEAGEAGLGTERIKPLADLLIDTATCDVEKARVQLLALVNQRLVSPS